MYVHINGSSGRMHPELHMYNMHLGKTMWSLGNREVYILNAQYAKILVMCGSHVTCS